MVEEEGGYFWRQGKLNNTLAQDSMCVQEKMEIRPEKFQVIELCSLHYNSKLNKHQHVHKMGGGAAHFINKCKLK